MPKEHYDNNIRYILKSKKKIDRDHDRFMAWHSSMMAEVTSREKEEKRVQKMWTFS